MEVQHESKKNESQTWIPSSSHPFLASENNSAYWRITCNKYVWTISRCPTKRQMIFGYCLVNDSWSKDLSPADFRLM